MSYTICLHPWALVEDVQTYAEDELDADGWCVYVREDDPEMDIGISADFDTYDAALAYATTLATKYDAEIDQY